MTNDSINLGGKYQNRNQAQPKYTDDSNTKEKHERCKSTENPDLPLKIFQTERQFEWETAKQIGPRPSNMYSHSN